MTCFVPYFSTAILAFFLTFILHHYPVSLWKNLKSIGFDPIITAAAGIISTLWGVLSHTQWIKRLGTLEYFFVTPSSHRVHHGSNEEYIDKNYGNLLIIWDRIFGTFADEKDTVVYGIRDNVKTFNPIKITFQFWVTMYQDYRRAKSFKDKILCFVGRPEWKPDQ